MKIIEVYEAVDGSLFKDEEEAKSHDLDCIGELFDHLLLTGATVCGNLTRADQHLICITMLEKRKELLSTLKLLTEYISEEINY